jgi:hypothetical protein
MTMDERIRFLLRAATRAEDEGNERVARNFRRMAEEARPIEGMGRDSVLCFPAECCFE